MMLLKLIFLGLLVRLTEQKVITTVQGKIRGVAHEGYVSYLGIPYASITENGKFKKAGLAPLWQGIRESHEPHCTAVSIEGCLQLDIHVPTSGRGQWPVLLWVSGGTAHYNTKQMVLEDIIIVIVHHRIGPSGFLCTDDPRIPGNAAVKDVVLAMKWVRDNIVAFRGNPAKVIVAGQSLGAAIVEAVTLSPVTNGLYYGIILQSGSVLSPWAFNYDAIQRGMKLARTLNGQDNYTNTIINAKLDEIVDKSYKLDVPYIPFGLCIESSFMNEENLITESPFNLLSNRKLSNVPMIIGYNNDEAYVFASILKESNALRTISDDATFLLPQELKFLNERERRQIGRQVADMYFKNNMSMSSLLVYHKDAYFMSHIQRSARLHASSQPVYFYQFSFNSDLGVQEEPRVKKTGAAHSDELAYLFSGSKLEGDQELVQRNLIKLWTNFVKYLNPSHNEATAWDPLDPDHPRFLDISTELKMMEFSQIRETTMWDDIYKKYYYDRYSRF